MKTNIAIILLIALGFVYYRGFKATTQEDFNCQFKTVYAVCESKNPDAQLPGVLDILKAGIKF